MKLEWIDDSIGDRKTWVLRDVDDGGRPKASIGCVWDDTAAYLLTVVGTGHIGEYDTLEEAQAVGTMLAPLPYAEKRAYKTVINRLN